MADGQQGIQSFDDLDKFVKQKPVPSSQPAQQQPGQQASDGKIEDFASFDKFVTGLNKPKKPGEKPEKPPKWGEVPFFNRPMSKQAERGPASPEDMVKSLKDSFGITADPKDPRLTKIWRQAYKDIDPFNHPINFVANAVEGGMRAIHEGAEWMFLGDDEKSPKARKAQMAQREVLNFNAALKDPSFTKDPKRKAAAEENLHQAMDHMANMNKEEPHYYDLDVMAKAAALTYVDWESMAAVFKPMEWAGEIAKDIPAARSALFAVNQALGAKFSWDSFQSGNDQWKQGNYWDAVREYGNAGALLVLPLMHHVMNEKGITQDQIRQKAYEEIEQKQQEVQKIQAAQPNAVLPITPEFLEDAKYRVANGLPMFGIGRPVPVDIPMPDVDGLHVGEKNLQNRLARENARTEYQRKIAKLEQDQRELAHKQTLAKEQAKTEAEKRQLLAELDERGKQLDREIQTEKERFKTESIGLQRPVQGPSAIEVPIPEKKPFEAQPLDIPGRLPMTREERESEWVEERRKRYLEMLQEEQAQRVRAGEEFNINDKRRFKFEPLPEYTRNPSEAATAKPGESTPPAPLPVTDRAPAAAAEPMAPPPQTRQEIHAKVAAASWENMALEAKKSQATDAKALAEIEQRMEDNRKLAGDLMADRIAAALEGRKPKAVKRGSAMEGPVGKSSELKTVTRNYPIRFRVIDGSNLKPSHDPMTFEPVDSYPDGVQERDYKNDKDAQLAVVQHTQNYDPNFTLSDAPGPEHGPPMVTPDGIVLGGNSRAMSTIRLYREGNGDGYRKALLERASQLGLKPEEIEAVKEPILVREILAPPTDVNELRALGSDLNKVFTRKLSEFEQAVSAGKRLTTETLDYILHQLQELGEGASLRDLLRERSKGILEKLEADGVIASTERRQFIDEKTDTLNDTGKDFVENAILGSVIDDPLVLANSPRAALRKIERSLSSVARIKARGGVWDISDYIKEALREHIAAASKGESIQDHLDPPTASMFPREPIHPIVEAIALKLDESSAEVKKAFDAYSKDAEMDVKGQETMAFFAPPTPWESFKSNFGLAVSPGDWGTVRATAPTKATDQPLATGTSSRKMPVAPLDPPPIGEVFDLEVSRQKTEEPQQVPHDLGEIELPKEGSPSERFRAESEKAFPKVSKEEMDAIMSIIDARAKALGKTMDQWIKEKKISVESQKRHNEANTTIRQTDKGFGVKQTRVNAEVEFMDDGRTIIRAFESGGESTVASFVHELGHIFRRDLPEADLKIAAEWAGVKPNDIWRIPQEEKFARGFERYLREGIAPTPSLRKVFEQFKTWMANIYRALKGSPININLSAEIYGVFKRMLTPPPDLTPASEKPRRITPPPAERVEVAVKRETELKAEIEDLQDQRNGITARGLEAVEDLYTPEEIDEYVQNAPQRSQLVEKFGPEEVEVAVKELLVDVAKQRYREEIEARKTELAEVSKFLEGKRPQSIEPPPPVEEKPVETAPKRREIEIPDPGPKKRYEPLDEPPRRSLDESLRGMSDNDVRSAARSLESQLERPGITSGAKDLLKKQHEPFRKELERRNILDKPEQGFGDKNAIFTKSRADSARERLRKKLATTVYSGIDPEVVRDVSEVMGYYFEGGIREFSSLARKVISEFGDVVRPFLRDAYDQMLTRGKVESSSPEQKSLFAPMREIVLPPGVEEEVRSGRPQAKPEERPPSVPPRETPDAGTRPTGREAARQASGAAGESKRSDGKPDSGRSSRPTRTGVGGSGVDERFEQPLRNVQSPKLDADHITDIPHVVEPTAWRKALKDANLPENLPPPTETLSPQVEAKLAFKGQPEIVQTVLTSLRKYHGAIMATSTGTGKTYMGSAVLAEKRPRFGLIVTPSQNIAQQWIDTAEIFGVEVKKLPNELPSEPGIYVTTYSTAANRRGPAVEGKPGDFLLPKIPWNMVIADESHYARRWHDEGNQRGKFLVDLSRNSENVLYASATPFHTPLELGYFDKLGLWSKTGLNKWLANEFGVRQGEGGKWVVPMNYRKLAALREELISRGMFVNLDRNMEGYSANFAVVPMSEETMTGVRGATQGFRLAEEYFKQKKLNKMVMAVRGNAATFMKSYLERQRLPEAIELGKKLDREGWKVIYFTESKKEVDELYNFLKPADEYYDGAIGEKLPKLPAVVDTLREAFGDDLADFTGAHSSRRQTDLDDFNNGRKKHLIATYGAGGVGVSLHDLSGEAPRAVIYLGPPWSGVMFDQAIGRPWRFGTKSNVSAYFLTSNAQPEMKLIFQKVLPRFESLKASVSGIKKSDPIVNAMKDLDSYLAYEFGNDTAVGFDQFMNTVPTSAVSSYKEASIVSAETAKNKGMKVERRTALDAKPSEPTKLKQSESEIPKDLSTVEDAKTDNHEKSAALLRRPFISEAAEREISDPRLLDKMNDENMESMGLDTGGEKPPGPPSEIIGNQQIPRPGESDVRRDDLAAPKIMQRVYEFAEKHFGEWGVPVSVIDQLAKAESGIRLAIANRHTAPYVLKQFPQTTPIVEGITHAEQLYRRDLGNMQYEKTKIFQENGLINDPTGRRKVDQALRLTDQGAPLSSLLGQPSKWLDGSVFKENELKAAQRIRDEIYEPVIEAVRNVRPDVGYRRKYSAVIRTMEDFVSTLYPELGGKVPADLVPEFSLEIRRSMTKDPFSPHTLKRQGEPPKTFDIDEVLEAYLPSMLRVKHYTKLSSKVARQLAELPDSTLKEFSVKYARIFFGVPSEYKRMDRIRFNLAKQITNLSYASALELNPLWFAMHLTKVPVNTFPELGREGSKYLAKGYERMMTEEGRELVARGGVLMDRLWVFPETFFELKKRPKNWMRLTTSMSDAIDRSASYLAALEKAKDMGFLGPKEEVGDLTWKRLNELSANGVDINKALDYANSVMARSEFLYTPAYVQMWQREHPILGMFHHYIFREAEFVSSLRKIAKEVKNHPDPEAFIEQKVSDGHYEYIDAVAKYRRLMISLTGAAAVAFGVGGPLFSRFFPFHVTKLLSSPILFSESTVELVAKTLKGSAKEDDWKSWLYDLFGDFTPYAGFAVRAMDPYSKFTVTKPKKKHNRDDFETIPVDKFQFDQMPQ